jgi:nitroimidazol reductase NimA-like FMN-containing flavoprotein (pyridoxamine 5'-phosphate oxidase superfamily)
VTNGEPVSTDPLVAGGSVMGWAEALVPLAEVRFYWLATVGPRGAPHVRPVLAVWVDGPMYSTTGPWTRKGRNLAADGRSSLTVRTDSRISSSRVWPPR